MAYLLHIKRRTTGLRRRDSQTKAQTSQNFRQDKPYNMSSSSLATRPYHKHPILLVLSSSFALLVAAVCITSYFLDDIVRARTEAAMNRTLKGYRVTLARAHLQLLDGTLSLRGLTIVQLAHPSPPVADADLLRFRIDWRQLLARRVVADILLSQPRLHINRQQLAAETHGKVPLKQEGWQDVLEQVYPLKINRFTIVDGDMVYIQDPASPPLHLAKVNFTSDNIRNIQSPNDIYPSKLQATLVVFDTGRATIDGNANFLEKPFPGGRVRFAIKNAPLSAFAPEIRAANVTLDGGHLSSSGEIEYSPAVTNAEVDIATIDGVKVDYVHKTATQQAETRRIKEVGKEIHKQNNRPKVHIDVRELDVRHSSFAFTDETKNPHYRLVLDDANLAVRNLSNHEQQGPANLLLQGKFMDTGATKVVGDFLARPEGPAFTISIAIVGTSLQSMNNLLRAYGRFDVAAGQLSVYSQVTVDNQEITGYVKPMFANIEVYNYKKDKNTGVLHQAKELAIGGAAHLLKSRETQQVATEVNLKGRLDGPNLSTWQAIVEVLRNAFIQAILPGFDHSVQGRIPAPSK
ncbi:MAG TPA: DUF748 domain-containing protein [Candidatus Binataceae bacterium]|nr:DUF748 domain-containing protein [Candidatus Binataceae bacterium]